MTNSFTLMAPQITPGDPMQLVKPGEWVTIAGAFFGDKKGEVYLCDTPGDTVAAKVRDWSMDSISFEIPEGLTGVSPWVSQRSRLGYPAVLGTLTPPPARRYRAGTISGVTIIQQQRVRGLFQR